MASFFDEIARNNLKSILLMLLFSVLFAFVVYLFVIFLGGGIFSLSIGLIFIIGYALFTYFAGDKVVLAVSRAKEADKGKYPQLYDVVEGLASAIQVPMPKVYIINDPNPNAFATGASRKKASVAVTSGLLSMMNRTELEGVLAHEMSHIQDNDMKFMMIAIVYAGVIGLVAAFIRNMLFWGVGGNRRSGGYLILIAILVGILAPIFAMLIRLAISRRREYMADANGARLIRNPAALAGALKKLLQYEKDPRSVPLANANELTASLYFSNPFKANSIMNLFSTHPPLQDRIDRLQKMY
ncbi:MAG: M48 family metalloprotease [Candidatus Micrarchaeota archaeon]|nr:M48 family metalloprotease [Candidatus Micrarchaeota archaeon]MDE1824287.1 M48 family metalloprotease [Candidatus Micrarchaeota archaeon]MDE1849766.1 M48 family metalloprotease [Candidatus Micrarchaeota archaeon]